MQNAQKKKKKLVQEWKNILNSDKLDTIKIKKKTVIPNTNTNRRD